MNIIIVHIKSNIKIIIIINMIMNSAWSIFIFISIIIVKPNR